MNIYNDIDEALDRLAETYGLVLHREFCGRPVRVFYQSGSRFNTIQISIDPPSDGKFVVYGELIEGDSEFDKIWQLNTNDAYDGLSSVVAEVRGALGL